MNVISFNSLLKQIEAHGDYCRTAALDWFLAARKSSWTSIQEVRMLYPPVDRVGRVVIFNLRGNAYRLIFRVSYRGQALYVKALLSRAEYYKKEWMKWVL